MIKPIKLALSVILLSITSINAQAGIIEEGGLLTGVTDITVDGQSRTFDFVDGTFNGLFGSVAYRFDVGDAAAQISAMIGLSPFANSAYLITGCVNTIFGDCRILLPNAALSASTGLPINASANISFFSSPSYSENGATLESTVDGPDPLSAGFDHVYAVLRPATTVPEPGAMGLLGFSLLGLVFARRVVTV